MISVEEWAEARRLHFNEGMSISGVASHLGRSRNTVKAALRSSEPPKYKRRRVGSRVGEFESHIRSLLRATPSMPTSVVMERVGWDGGKTVFYDRVAQIRRDYKVADPVDKLVHLPGEMMQWDLWFPGVLVGLGQGRGKYRPAVLVAVLPHSKIIRALLIPSIKGFDILAGMYLILTVLGVLPRRFLWDRQSGIATRAGNPTGLLHVWVTFDMASFWLAWKDGHHARKISRGVPR